MLFINKVFCISLLQYYVSGNIIQNKPPKNYGFIETPQLVRVSNPPSTQCAPDKSLNSKNDIKAMINYIYNEKSLDKIIKESYQSKAKEIRDKHTQDITDFIGWFANQPEHLKHVLVRLDKLRKEEVEPAVKMVADVLKEYPNLEILYNEKNNKTNELLNKLNRYKMVCKIYNCEDQQVNEHHVTKRNVQDDFYCSSLQDLHSEITEKLDQIVKKKINSTTTKLITSDKMYEEKTQIIKSKLKDKALNEFGRTMYDILSLVDEYHHFMDNIRSTDLNTIVYDIKNLSLYIDTNLLQLEQAIEKFGKYCYTCGSKPLVRSIRKSDLEPTEKVKTDLVNNLIENKSNEIENEIDNDWKSIFDDLNTWIQKTEIEKDSLEKLKPIQIEVNTLTNAEKDAIVQLKNLTPKLSIKIILDLIKKLKDLLKIILDNLNKLPK